MKQKILTLNDVFAQLQKVTDKGTRVTFRLQFAGETSDSITLGALDDYVVAERFTYDNKSYFKYSEITHDVAKNMIEYINYHKSGAKREREIKIEQESNTTNVSDILLQAHKTGGVAAVNAFLMAGIK